MSGLSMEKQQLLYDALKAISREYMTPAQIARDTPNSGLSRVEYLEMAYENIQELAKRVTKGIRRPKASSLRPKEGGL